jgi:hypothetical protein
MPETKYRVEVGVAKSPTRENVYAFKSIEVMPPLPRSLANLACEGVINYIESHVVDEPLEKKDKNRTVLTPHGFCDEGAQVSTLITFDNSRAFREQDEQGLNSRIAIIRRAVEIVISPTGVAIAE